MIVGWKSPIEAKKVTKVKRSLFNHFICISQMGLTCNNIIIVMRTIDPSSDAPNHKRILSRASLIFLLVLVVILAFCLIFSWTTRDAMAHLPFLSARGNVRSLANNQKTLVDLDRKS